MAKWKYGIDSGGRLEPYSNRERQMVLDAIDNLSEKFNIVTKIEVIDREEPLIEWDQFWWDCCDGPDNLADCPFDRIAAGLSHLHPEIGYWMLIAQEEYEGFPSNDDRFYEPDLVLSICWAAGIRVERLPDDECDQDLEYADAYARDEYRKDWYDYQEEYIDNWDDN